MAGKSFESGRHGFGSTMSKNGPAVTTVRTVCRWCLAGCGMNVTVEDGKLTKVKGDKSDPLSKGFLCAKGRSSIAITQAPQRVIYPQKRIGERGSGQWQRVTWDQALDDIAARLKEIIATHGARAVAVQALTPKEYFAYDLFRGAIGSPTFFRHNSHQCLTPQVLADGLTFGNLVTYPGFVDLDNVDVVLLWGINQKEIAAPNTTASRRRQDTGCAPSSSIRARRAAHARPTCGSEYGPEPMPRWPWA